MAEEEKVVTKEVEDNTQDYLKAIQDLKQNSVDRSEYEKLKAENKKLINAVVNGQDIEVEGQPKVRDTDEIRDELFNQTWDAGNNYVGKYSKLEALNDTYVGMLNAWLLYLKTGKRQKVDYFDITSDENTLINEIQSIMKA